MTNLEKYIVNLRADKKSQHTIVAYTNDIEQMLVSCKKPEEVIDLMDLIAWKETISDMSSATVARKIIAVRGYFEFLNDINVIDTNPAKKLKAPKIKNKEKVVLQAEQVREMVKQANNPRDKAIILVLAQACLRISELINLKMSDLLEDAIIVRGKGDKDRVVYFTDEAKRAIENYLDVRKDSGIDNLFVSNQGTPMKRECVSDMLKKLGRRSGLKNVSNISNHLMRATGATIMADNGVPIQRLQDILGHAEISTTRIYVKNSQKRLQEDMVKSYF